MLASSQDFQEGSAVQLSSVLAEPELYTAV